MNIQQLTQIAIDNISPEEFPSCKIDRIFLDDESSNHKCKTYLGEVFYLDEGKQVSSVFNIFVYGNGTHEFEWS